MDPTLMSVLTVREVDNIPEPRESAPARHNKFDVREVYRVYSHLQMQLEKGYLNEQAVPMARRFNHQVPRLPSRVGKLPRLESLLRRMRLVR